MKKLFVYLLLLSILYSCSVNNNISDHNLRDIISIEFKLENDSLCFGDSLLINVRFTNKTSEPVYFYPNAVIMLERISYTHASHLMCLNQTCQDYKSVSKIDGLCSIDTIYKVRLERTFFVPGKNLVCVLYRAFRQKKSNKNNYEPLFGYLDSDVKNLKICND